LVYDVVVVGAGPAGATSARYAASSGAKTLIIDKKREIGKPVRCAEVVAGTLPGNFGMKNSAEWLINQAHFFNIISPSNRVVKINTSPYVGYVLSREAFERELVSLAVDCGSDLILGKTVTGITKSSVVMGSKEIKAKIIIAADGVDSRIGRLAGIKTKSKISMLGSCTQHTLVNIDVDFDSLEFYFGSTHAPGGYAWVFPKSENEANVGVGILKSDMQRALSVLDRFIKNKFPKGKSIRFVSGCVPSALPPTECVRQNVLVVGDSARQVTPFTGAGIANAFVAGKIAGELVADVAVNNQPVSRLAEYDMLWRNVMEKKISKSYRLRNKVLYNDRKIERFVTLLKITPKFILRRFLRRLHY
jgi:digeranylgeranylglycerophospholipid reductase